MTPFFCLKRASIRDHVTTQKPQFIILSVSSWPSQIDSIDIRRTWTPKSSLCIATYRYKYDTQRDHIDNMEYTLLHTKANVATFDSFAVNGQIFPLFSFFNVAASCGGHSLLSFMSCTAALLFPICAMRSSIPSTSLLQ